MTAYCLIVRRDLQRATCQIINFRKRTDVLTSICRNLEMMVNRTFVSPSICTAFISFNMLEVTANRFCTRSIQLFCAFPDLVDTGTIAMREPIAQLALELNSGFTDTARRKGDERRYQVRSRVG